jgi:lipoprotein-anchoring transpeptidase ErfK/SrfK
VKTRYLVIAALLLVIVLLAAAGAVYAYDNGRSQQIAEGVSIDGIPIGGMKVAQARAKLRSGVLEPLSRPVVATYHHRKFTLTPKAAGVGVDIDGSVQAAIDASRSGSFITRTWRDVTGGKVKRDVPLHVTYSQAAIDKVVARVSRKLNEPARDADVGDLENGEVNPTASKNGLRVRNVTLRRALKAELLDRGDRAPVAVRTKVVRPKVTSKKLAEEYPAIILVNRGAFRLTLYKNLKPSKSYGIAVGQVGLETPAGLYHVQNKAINPAWHVPNSAWAGKLAGTVIPGGTPENPLKARWLGIFDGAGIHGTDAIGSIGTAASHGCIRMRIPDVEELYDQVPVGAPVYIA